MFPQNERFWYFSKKQLTLQYVLLLSETKNTGAIASDLEHNFQVLEIRNEGEIERPGKSLVRVSVLE